MAVVALLTGGWAPKPPAPAVITSPDWLERPSGEIFMELYPKLASAMEVEGRATISCSVNAFGDLEGCAVVAESPTGFGFAGAALAMSAHFRMRPQTLDGEPVSGGTIRVPIRFTLPANAPHPEAGPALIATPSNRALVLAGRLIDDRGYVDEVIERFEKEIRELEFLTIPDVAETTRFAAADAVRAAAKAHVQDYREGFVRALARTFTEAELDQLLAYYQSPAGRLRADAETNKAIGDEMNVEYWRRARVEAHAIYCDRHACDGRAEAIRVWRAEDAAAGYIDEPAWSEQPDEDDLEGARPPLAGLLGLTGIARLRCKVRLDGRPEDCAAVDEAPAGFGYGAAAVALATHYRLSPQMLVQGASGERVIVRILIPPSEPAEAADLPMGRSARAIALGRKLVANSKLEASAHRDIDAQAAGYMSKAPSGAAAQAYGEAVAAFQAGARRAMAAYLDQSANAWAARYTEAELAGLLAMMNSPGDRLLGERNEALYLALAAAYDQTTRRVSAEASEAFCRNRDCGRSSAEGLRRVPGGPAAAEPPPPEPRP